MNLKDLIRQLNEEKKRLDQTIASLEAIWQLGEPGAAPGKRKGRKTMPEKEREEVSRRMKQYWAAWRRQRAKRAPKKKAAEAQASPPPPTS